MGDLRRTTSYNERVLTEKISSYCLSEYAAEAMHDFQQNLVLIWIWTKAFSESSVRTKYVSEVSRKFFLQLVLEKYEL